MKYSKFIITNYKGLPKIGLELNRKPNTNIFTLVGLNESGKTSILEAIYLFQNGILKENAHTLIPKSRQYSFNDFVSVKAELELDKDDLSKLKTFLQENYKFYLKNDAENISIEKKYNFNRSIPLETDDWLETLWITGFVGKTKQSKKEKRLYDWNKDAWNKTLIYIKENFLPKILYYPDFLFKFPEKIYLEEFQNEGPEQKEYRSVIRDVLETIDNKLNLEQDLLEKMKKSQEKSYKNALDQLLLKMSSKLNDEILKKWDEIFGSGQKKEVDINWNSETNTDGTKKYFIELKIKQGSDSYSINDRSLGFKWFFSFLIFTAFRKSRSSDPGETLFLLDEPASNLHQRSQQKLLQSLNEIVSDCKLIYSTHSHHMINPKWLAGTYIVKNEAINYGNPEDAKTTETKINAILYKNFVAKYPDEEDHFKPIMDALQYTPSKLEVVPSTIFTEGKNDYYTFKYISNVILKNKYKLFFYPGAGVDKYSDVFRLYLSWNRDFVSLFDSDSPGNKAKERYIEEIGPDVVNRLFTFKDVDNKWENLQTENLFLDEEKIEIIMICFEDHKKENGYNKSKFNTAIQQLYIDEQKINLSKKTKDNFIKVFKFLINKLKILPK
mgnify:CR=1 FL=1